MSPVGAAGVVPATLPDRRDVDLDAELVDLLCEDAAWLEETFRDIVAASWAEPPRGGAVPPAARPRRYGTPGPRRLRVHRAAPSQWTASPRGRQRSPPRPRVA